MPFQKGDDPNRLDPAEARSHIEGPKAGKKPLPAYYSPPEDGASETLQALRHVWLNADKRHDTTEGQRIARELRVKDSEKFMRMKDDLESAHKKERKQEAAAVVGAEVVDVGTDKAIAQCVEFLQDCRKKAEREAEEARPKFRCPSCGHVGVLPVGG